MFFPVEPMVWRPWLRLNSGREKYSVTDRCNIRCFYCMPEYNPVFMARREILTFEEIERFVRVAVRLMYAIGG